MKRIGRAGFELPSLVPLPGDIILCMHKQRSDARDIRCLQGAQQSD
jgi:hypothetical protein